MVSLVFKCYNVQKQQITCSEYKNSDDTITNFGRSVDYEMELCVATVVRRKDNKGGSYSRLFREVTGSIPVSGLLAEVPFGAVTEYYITEADEY